MTKELERLEQLKLRAAALEALLKDKFRLEGMPTGLDEHEEISYETALLLQELGDAIPVPVFIKNTSGTFTYCNYALEQLLNLKREEIVGQQLRDLFPEQVAGEITRCNLELLQQGSMQIEDRTLPLKRGGSIEVQIHRSLMRDNAGKVIGIIGVLMDLSQQRSAQRAREISETRYRSLFINARDAIFLLDGQQFIDCNPAATRLYALSEEELIGRHPSELSPPFQPSGKSSTEEARLMIESTLKGERQYFEWTHLKGDGSTFDAEVSLSPLRLDGKDLVLAIVRDITERKRTEAALEASEEFSRGMIQHAPMGVMYTDLDGTLIYENQVMERLMGVPEGQTSLALGRRLQDLPGLQKVAITPLLEKVAAGEAVHNVAVEYTSIYDQKRSLHVQIAPHTSSAGNVVGAIFMIQDVTELRRLEEQLHHAQKMDAVGNLAGGIAHDFNNLLTGISGNAEMALQHLDDREKTEAALRELISISERASQLTRRLLSFSRRQEHNPRPVILAHLVEELRRMLQRLIGEEIDLELQRPPGPPWVVRVDAGQMEQVIVNLVVNARDAMPEGGCVTLDIRHRELDADQALALELQPGPHIQLRVKDTGNGIHPDHFDQIFDPFFTTKEAGKGTGLGLSIVYGVIRQCDGIIRVTSQPGCGACFEIHLPSMGAVEVVESGYEAKRELHFAREGEEILVIEDEDAVRELTVRCLEHCGYAVLAAANGHEALDIARGLKRQVDLVLSDVIMPGMSGPAAVRKLRDRWPDLKVLFCSGYTDGELKKHNLSPEEGAALLNKPYSLEELSFRIRHILDEGNAE